MRELTSYEIEVVTGGDVPEGYHAVARKPAEGGHSKRPEPPSKDVTIGGEIEIDTSLFRFKAGGTYQTHTPD